MGSATAPRHRPKNKVKDLLIRARQTRQMQPGEALLKCACHPTQTRDCHPAITKRSVRDCLRFSSFRETTPRSNPAPEQLPGLLRRTIHRTAPRASRLTFTPAAIRPSIPDRLAGPMRRSMLWLIGQGVAAVGQKRIPVAIAAASGGHRLALLQGGEAAAPHSGGDVLAAILSCGSRRRHRGKGQCEQRRGRCCGDLQKLFHVVLPVLVSNPKSTDGRSGNPAPSASEKSKAILFCAREEIETRRRMIVLKDNRHLTRTCDCHMAVRESSAVPDCGFGREASRLSDRAGVRFRRSRSGHPAATC
jgi:hypothetical protein